MTTFKNIGLSIDFFLLYLSLTYLMNLLYGFLMHQPLSYGINEIISYS